MRFQPPLRDDPVRSERIPIDFTTCIRVMLENAWHHFPRVPGSNVPPTGLTSTAPRGSQATESSRSIACLHREDSQQSSLSGRELTCSH
jgi:hypothetical protein